MMTHSHRWSWTAKIATGVMAIAVVVAIVIACTSQEVRFPNWLVPVFAFRALVAMLRRA
jgi:hypothetical protein